MVQHMQHPSSMDSSATVETKAEQGDHYAYLQALQALRKRLHGELVLPEDPEYESARIVWNGEANCHPAFIVRCFDADDVAASVTFAKQQGLALSVRSGGHSPAGYGSNDGGIVIDLSQMKAISIDPERCRARLEAGLTWSEVANALQPYGLALTSGDTGTVGVGGLMLGGGIGWMVRKYGMTIDHLRAVELVTADGQHLRASSDEHPDLFWGLRGGGGNFGIATAFEVEIHQAGMVLGGAVFYEMAEAEAILKKYARYAVAAPEELTTMALLMAAPPAPFIPPSKQGVPVVAIFICYTGDLTQGEQVIAPLRKLGTIVADVISPIPYPVMFAFTEEASKPGFPQYVRSLFVSRLSDKLVQKLVTQANGVISLETMVQIRIMGGAMARIPIDATAFAHRDKQVMVSVFDTEWQPGNNEHLTRAEQLWQALSPYAEGVYVNFLADEGEQRIHQAYPPETYTRLAALKERYDPTNLFHFNQNIRPIRNS
ncbi:MAG: FAD-binding oxidoreductase [Ktedonobacteraceae bacterium]